MGAGQPTLHCGPGSAPARGLPTKSAPGGSRAKEGGGRQGEGEFVVRRERGAMRGEEAWGRGRR